MLDPESAVLIEGGDPFLWRDKIRLPAVVVLLTKSIMTCFAGPSFQEGSGACAEATVRPASMSADTARVLRSFNRC